MQALQGKLIRLTQLIRTSLNILFREGIPAFVERLYRWLKGERRFYHPPAPRNPLYELLSPEMNILLISHDLRLGGASVLLYHVAVFLRRAGYYVTVASPTADTLKAELERAGVPVVIEPAFLSDPQQVQPWIGTFDLVVANTLLNWASVNAAASAGRPVMWMIHEPAEWLKTLLQWPEEAAQAFRRANAIVYSARNILWAYKAFAEQGWHTTACYGIPDPLIEAEGIPSPCRREEGKLYLAHVGTIEPRKAPDILLHSLKQLPAPLLEQIEVYFVGYPVYPAYLQVLKDMAQGYAGIHFVGEGNPRDSLGYIKEADILVSTSRQETGPLVVLEAMGLGKTVITTRVGMMEEVIRHGSNGYLINVDDVEELTAILSHLARNRLLLRRVGQAARRKYEEALTLDRYGRDLLQIMGQMLRRIHA
mgnify:CR=1 FL=1